MTIGKKWQLFLAVALVLAVAVSLFAIGCAAKTTTVTQTETKTVAGTAATVTTAKTVTATTAAPTYKIKARLGGSHPPEHPQSKHAYAFCDVIRDMTQGRIDITYYPSNTLADWVEMNELVMRGDVEFSINPFSEKYEAKLAAIYYVPYVGKNVAELKKAYAKGGAINELTKKLVEPLGIKALSVYGLGMSGCTLKKVPPSPGDPDVAKNMKIRVMPLKVCELTYKALGYMPVAIPYAEAYSAIQTGVADGEMGGPPTQGYQFRDVQGCWIQYNDFMETHWWFCNKKFFDSLAPVDQKIIEDVSNWLGMLRWYEIEAEDQEYRQKMKDYGLTIVVPTDAELQKCADKVRKEVWPEVEKLIGTDLMDVILNAVGIKRPY